MQSKMFKKAAVAITLAVTGAVSFSNVYAASIESMVPAHSSKFYTMNASYGEVIRAFLSGDGDTDLELFIRNSSGQTICSSENDNDDEICRVRVQGGRYTLEVRNLGSISNVFDLFVD